MLRAAWFGRFCAMMRPCACVLSERLCVTACPVAITMPLSLFLVGTRAPRPFSLLRGTPNCWSVYKFVSLGACACDFFVSIVHLLSTFRATSSGCFPPRPLALCFDGVLLRTSQGGGPGPLVEGATLLTNHTRRAVVVETTARASCRSVRGKSRAPRPRSTRRGESSSTATKAITRDMSSPIALQGPQHVTRSSAPLRGALLRLRRRPPPSHVPHVVTLPSSISFSLSHYCVSWGSHVAHMDNMWYVMGYCRVVMGASWDTLESYMGLPGTLGALLGRRELPGGYLGAVLGRVRLHAGFLALPGLGLQLPPTPLGLVPDLPSTSNRSGGMPPFHVDQTSQRALLRRGGGGLHQTSSGSPGDLPLIPPRAWGGLPEASLGFHKVWREASHGPWEHQARPPPGFRDDQGRSLGGFPWFTWKPPMRVPAGGRSPVGGFREDQGKLPGDLTWSSTKFPPSAPGGPGEVSRGPPLVSPEVSPWREPCQISRSGGGSRTLVLGEDSQQACKDQKKLLGDLPAPFWKFAGGPQEDQGRSPGGLPPDSRRSSGHR